MPFLFAQTPSDISGLAGNAGWTGVGLLGAILAWLLLWHLPRKDSREDESRKLYLEKIESVTASFAATVRSITSTHSEQMQSAIDRQDRQMEKLAASYESEGAKQRADGIAALKLVIDHCDREADVLRDIRDSVAQVRELVNKEK